MSPAWWRASRRSTAASRPIAPTSTGADFDCEVNVAGLYARTDTLVHADVNGAAAVPPEHVPAILEAAAAIAKKEQAIIDFCRDPTITVEGFKRFWSQG